MALGKFLKGIFRTQEAQADPTTTKPEQDWVVFTRLGSPNEIISVDVKFPQLHRFGYEYYFAVEIVFAPDMLNEHGMPLPRMADVYYKIEDDLEVAIPSIIKVATRVTPGLRRVWFAANKDVLAFINAELAKIANLSVKATAETHSAIDMLLPTHLENQKIQNYKILDTIGQHGDNGKMPREVMHWMYLGDQVESKNLVSDIEELGYTVHETDDEKIVFGKQCSLVLKELDLETESLNKLADKYGASYDGWETPVFGAANSTH